MRSILLMVLLPLAAPGAQYSAQLVTIDGVEVARFADASRGMEVSVIPSLGNTAYEFKMNGTNVLLFPFSGPADFKRRPAMCCIPFMAPWTNGVHDAYFANGKRYTLNTALLKEGEGPLRGLVMFATGWKVASCIADDRSASLTSQLEFWKNPRWMAQFPFAHTITMTYRLADGALEVETSIENQSMDPMPVGVGLHPYFTVADAPRTAWSVHIPAKQIMPLGSGGLPTGQRAAMDRPDIGPLGQSEISSVYTSLIPSEDGRAHFWVRGAKQQIGVALGSKFQVAVVYAPPGENYINIEPLTGIGNAFELAHTGVYKDLQSIPPGGSWKESFRITPSGF